MSNLRRTKLKEWFEFYRETCPVCNHRGGCMINSKGDTVVCIRHESDIQFSKNFPSWIHRLRKKRERKPAEDAAGTFIEGNEKAAAEELNRVFKELVNCTTLADAHYDHLSSRKMLKGEITLREYRSFPAKPWNVVKRISKSLQVDSYKGIPGFYQTNYGWSLSGREGILIPYRNQFNEIVGFQTRIDNPPNDVEVSVGSIPGLQARVKQQPNLVQIMVSGEIIEEVELTLNKNHMVCFEKGIGFVKLVRGQRYFWISSANKKNGTGAGDPMPVHVAVPTKDLANWTPGVLHKAPSVWITEGALKADIAVEHIEKVYSKEELTEIGTTFLAIAGVNTWSSVMPILKEVGVERVNIAFDMDSMENPQVAYYLKQLALALKSEGYAAYLAVWSSLDGKGVDDTLSKKRFPTLKKLF
ncbi:DUF3854 domain-containing protein [Bacillus sp. NRRL B-14911]|uniref:DUF3854 domain-containing protein n=1 Tax=Bacillus sp. NRRL B-14911 TaxID=313627 RepID=UPI000847A8AC|nr:DUF3854 domain-containing protein [Bacillus sp. NRRL B-14911]